MKYHQCKLRLGDTETVGWIEERGAKLGAKVELIKMDGNFWTVTHVSKFGISAKDLKDKQERDRHCLPSLQHVQG